MRGRWRVFTASISPIGGCAAEWHDAKTLADFRVGHGAALEDLLIDSFAGLVIAGVASLNHMAQDGVRVRSSAGPASFRRHSTLEDPGEEAAQAVRRGDPGARVMKMADAGLRPAYNVQFASDMQSGAVATVPTWGRWRR